jgi:acyl-CoA thioesterase
VPAAPDHAAGDAVADADDTTVDGEASWIGRLVDLDRRGGSDTFVARSPTGGTNQDGRLFGGLIAAQALAAAAATVDPAKLPQSLHLYFVRGGRPAVDVDMVVERTRDGRSFDTRRVTAVQDDKVILEMLASFHVSEPGVDRHPPAPPMPPVDECTSVGDVGGLSDRFEMRVPQTATIWGPPHWVRMLAPVEDDPVIRACALAFMSDMGLMAAARPPGTPLRFGPGFQAASLDHSVWFHRPFVPDRWHCYQASPINNVGSRGLAVGGFYDESGALVASMAQEALWRLGDG